MTATKTMTRTMFIVVAVLVVVVVEAREQEEPQLELSALEVPSVCDTVQGNDDHPSSLHTVQILKNTFLSRGGGGGPLVVNPTVNATMPKSTPLSSPLGRISSTCAINGWKTALLTAVVDNVQCSNDSTASVVNRDPRVITSDLNGMGGCSVQMLITDPCFNAEAISDDGKKIGAVLVTVLVRNSNLDIVEVVVAPNTTACSSHEGYACCMTNSGKEIPVMVQIRVTNVTAISVNLVLAPSVREKSVTGSVVLSGPQTQLLFDTVEVETVGSSVVAKGGMQIVSSTPILFDPFRKDTPLWNLNTVWSLTYGAVFALRNSSIYKKVVSAPAAGILNTGALELRVSLSVSNGSVFGMEGVRMYNEYLVSGWVGAACFALLEKTVSITVMNGSMWLAKRIDCHVHSTHHTTGMTFVNGAGSLRVSNSSLMLFHTVRVVLKLQTPSRDWKSTHTYFAAKLFDIAHGSQLKFMNNTLLELESTQPFSRRFIESLLAPVTIEDGGEIIISSCGVEGTVVPPVTNVFMALRSATTWIDSPSKNNFTIRCSHMENDHYVSSEATYLSGGDDLREHLNVIPEKYDDSLASSATSDRDNICLDMTMVPIISSATDSSTETFFCDANIECFGPGTVRTRVSATSCTCICDVDVRGREGAEDPHNEGAGCLSAYTSWSRAGFTVLGNDARTVSASRTSTDTLSLSISTMNETTRSSTEHASYTQTSASSSMSNLRVSMSSSETLNATQTQELPVSRDSGVVKLWTPEAQTVVSTATVSVAASAVSGSSTSDAQAMIIVVGGLVACIKSDAMQSVSGSGREILSPLKIPFAGDRYDAVAGLVVLVVVLAVVNVTVAVVLHLTVMKGSHWTAAFAKVRCPSLIIVGYFLAYPGLVQQMAFLAFEDPKRTSGDVVGFVFLCIIVPGFLVSFLRLKLNHLQICVFSTLGALWKYPRVVRRLVLPVGWWPSESGPTTVMFKTLLSPLKGEVRRWFWVVVFTLSKSFVPAVVGSGVSSCDAKIGILIAYQFGSAILVFVVWPFRVGMANIASMTLSVVTGMIVVFIKAGADSAAVQCAMYTSSLALCFSACLLVLKLFERRWTAKERDTMVQADQDASGDDASAGLSVPLMDLSDQRSP